MGPVDIVNTNVYKTETILTGLGHGKLPYILTLLWHFKSYICEVACNAVMFDEHCLMASDICGL